jgi:hypothetical protein
MARGFLALTVLTLLATTSCRSGRRGVRADGDAVTLKANITGMQPNDVSHPEWIYEISGCVPVANGVYDSASQSATFQSAGFKTGLTGCQLKIRALTPAVTNAKPTILAEPDIVYWCSDFEVGQTSDGELKANVAVKQTYFVEPPAGSGFTLKVPVKFPSKENYPGLTATLDCEPKISAIGVYPAGNPVEGDFAFAVPLSAATGFNCTGIHIEAEIANKYKGTMTAPEGNFTATIGQTLSLKQVSLLALQDPSAVNVDIKTDQETCLKKDMVYDQATRSCTAKPQSPAPQATTSP